MKFIQLIQLMFVFVAVGCITLAVNFRKVGAFCLLYVVGLLFSFGNGNLTPLALMLYGLWLLATFVVILRLGALVPSDDSSVTAAARAGMLFGLILGTLMAFASIFSETLAALVIQSAVCLVFSAFLAGATWLDQTYTAVRRTRFTRGL